MQQAVLLQHYRQQHQFFLLLYQSINRFSRLRMSGFLSVKQCGYWNRLLATKSTRPYFRIKIYFIMDEQLRLVRLIRLVRLQTDNFYLFLCKQMDK